MERLTMPARASEKKSAAKPNETEREKFTPAKLLRVLTVPPIMALFLVTMLYVFHGKNAFATPLRYVEAVFTLALLPVLAYPLCAAVPSLRKKGRKMQRSMAIVFSLLGYVMGLLFALLCGGTKVEQVLYITYMISGALMGLMTFLFHFRASGHTCGAAGPFAMLAHQLGAVWLVGYLLLIPVCVSSIRLKRHSIPELIAGGAISVISYFFSAWLIGII